VCLPAGRPKGTVGFPDPCPRPRSASGMRGAILGRAQRVAVRIPPPPPCIGRKEYPERNRSAKPFTLSSSKG